MSTSITCPAPVSGQDWDDLLRIREETDAPEGCKVEIIEAIVTVSPPPSEAHDVTAELLQRRLQAVLSEDVGIHRTVVVCAPSRNGVYLPDLVVLPRDAVTSTGSPVAAGDALLVVEITSKATANHDRIKKAHGYAKAGAELFLLLDPCHSGRPTATLYGEAVRGSYRVLEAVEYGGRLTLPEPFGLDLDTGIFPVG